MPQTTVGPVQEARKAKKTAYSAMLDAQRAYEDAQRAYEVARKANPEEIEPCDCGSPCPWPAKPCNKKRCEGHATGCHATSQWDSFARRLN